MRAMVTGADGLLGSNLVRELLARGYEVRVLIHPASKSSTLTGLPIERIQGDLLDAGDLLARSVDGCDHVFHCAGIADIFADAAQLEAVNVTGTERVIDACLKTRPRRLVFVGSASSIQFGPLEAPGDEHGGFPDVYRGIPYFDTKYAAKGRVDAAVREHDLDAVIVCPTFMLGRYDHGPSSGDLIRRYVAGELRFVSRGGRNFVHVRDVAVAMCNATARGERGTAYILGGANLAYRDFFGLVAAATGGECPRVLPDVAVRAAGAVEGAVARLRRRPPRVDATTARLACLDTYYSSARARAELDMPETPIEIAIEDAIGSLVEYGHIEADRP